MKASEKRKQWTLRASKNKEKDQKKKLTPTRGLKNNKKTDEN